MKILYSVTGAVFGGAVAHVLSLMRADVKAGHSVGLVAAPEPRLMSEAKDIGVHVFPNPYFVHGVQPLQDIRALWPVFRGVQKFKPDIISAHSTKAGYAARFAGAILRKKVVFTAHGWPFTEGRGAWQRCLLALVERLASMATVTIICVSAYDQELALKFKVASLEKLVLIHNGVDPAPLLNARGEQVRREFGLGKVPVLVMVGRLTQQKDPLTLLEACRLLETNFRLMMVGDGELRDKVEEFVARNNLRDKVTFTGERNDIPEILAASDILILDSRWEGLPLIIIEAEIAGLPVVASGVGGVPELIEDGVTGFIVPPRNPQALANVIQKLLGDANLRHRVGSVAREKALREFTFQRMLTKTQQLYKDILKNKA
ncbi:MAG: glycosyltransferase family 4 protein [Dehalococcoidales bacterium]